MNQQFQIASQLINDIFHLPIQPLDTKEQVQQFSKTYMLHAIQDFLEPNGLWQFTTALPKGKIYYIIDKFQIQFILVRLHDHPLIAGPFCSLILTQHDCLKHLQQYQITSLHVHDLLTYRSQFPIIREQDALHILHSFIHLVNPEEDNWETLTIDNCHLASFTQTDNQENPLRKNYGELIQERYLTEQRFVYDIENGNYHGAILNLRNMQRDVAFLKQIGTTLENERIGAAIVRTMVRFAAIRAGLPAATVDLLSRNNMVATLNAKSIEDIYREKEKMVREFCAEIQTHKNHHYSNLVLSAIYYIEHQYPQNITVNQIAEELTVSTNYLISVFRRETGLTPGGYIRRTRLKQAGRLLASTDLSIQDISNMCGIPDANYFTKLFKREYSLTPGQYRRYYRL